MLALGGLHETGGRAYLLQRTLHEPSTISSRCAGLPFGAFKVGSKLFLDRSQERRRRPRHRFHRSHVHATSLAVGGGYRSNSTIRDARCREGSWQAAALASRFEAEDRDVLTVLPIRTCASLTVGTKLACDSGKTATAATSAGSFLASAGPTLRTRGNRRSSDESVRS